MSVLAALILASAAPAFAAGGWQAGGSVQEPSTSYDTNQYMFQEPNQLPVDKLYYNGFIIDGYIPMAAKNLEGGSTTNSLMRLAAYLGFWRDCNGDGYVGAKSVPEAYASSYGHFSNGAYPADLFEIDETVCPLNQAYNQGAFIDEFRWVGPNATPSESEIVRSNKFQCDPGQPMTVFEDCSRTYGDMYDVTDSDAIAWVDLSRPSQQAANTKPFLAKEAFDNSSSTLYQTVGWLGLHELVEGREVETPAGTFVPVEEGTYDGIPTFGDCGGAEKGERDFAEDGEKFLGVTSTCGMYPLWQAKRLVNDSESERDEAEPVVYVFDTENDDGGEPGSACDDTTLPSGHAFADIDPRIGDDPLMEGSLGGTIWGNIFRGTGSVPFNMDGECGGGNPPSLTSSSSGTPGKKDVDTFLVYYPDTRYRGARAVGLDNVPTDALGLMGGPAAPYSASSRWLSFHVYIIYGVAGSTRPYWTTFYADVSPEAFEISGASPSTALPAGGQDVHTYGGVECSGDTADTAENRVANEYGWICSQTVWQEEADEFNEGRDPDGVDRRLRVIVGQAFDLRDVDCYDNTVFKGNVAGEDVDAGTGDIYFGVEASDNQVTVRTACDRGTFSEEVETVNAIVNDS